MSSDCGDCPINITDCYNKFCIPADDVSKGITVINEQLPAPPIIVSK